MSSPILLDNGILQAEILLYGAALNALRVKDKDGNPADVVLGFDSLGDRKAYSAYQGETVGRYANRIAGGTFSLNGKTYTVTKNENGKTCLHGGGEFSHTEWAVKTQGEDFLTLTYTSPDGVEGFPGQVTAETTYVLDGNALQISFTAVSDADTIVNMCNHAYFNLAGGGDVLGHILQLKAYAYLPIDADSIPTGEVRPLEGTAFDFREAKAIGADIRADDPQLIGAKGYDHCYCLEPQTLTPVANVYEPISGRRMEVFTDQPGIQLYTGNFLDSPGKNGAVYTAHSGFCLETQTWPDSPNRADFPSPLLKAGEEYYHTVRFVFSAG
ncbi:MAG: galactose mutarotase [Oscillospiraceae bacterium]|jgi:aldose 1-epimerase|nr:galactose mutarotase [Oscillospiraceae bacterium]